MKREKASKAELDRLLEAIALARDESERKRCRVRYLMAYYGLTRRVAETI